MSVNSDNLETLLQSASRPRAVSDRLGEGIGQIGEYVLLEKIGQGGMGMVFKAWQPSLSRTVALKTLLVGEHAQLTELQRFRSEAEAMAGLEHPGIVPVYEVGEADRLAFFSMTFVEGPTLKDRLDEGPLPANEAAAMLADIADAIGYAHGNGVIHRDLKPGNILINTEGKPLVADFGLSKRIKGESEQLTATGNVLGTPSYMAPEQAGAKQELTPAADIYALGALLYDMLTGRPPFQAASVMDTLMQVMQDDPVAPRSLNPKVNRDLETICLKCLQKEPSQRYATAGDLATDLRKWLADEPIAARRATASERAFKWVRRHPALTTAIALTFLAMFGLGAAMVAVQDNTRLQDSLAETEAARNEERTARREAEDARSEEALARATAEQAVLEAKQADYLRKIALASAHWELREAYEIPAILESIPEESRGWEWRYFNRLVNQHEKEFQWQADNLVMEADFLSDGRRLVCGAVEVAVGDPWLQCIDAETGAVHWRRDATLENQNSGFPWCLDTRDRLTIRLASHGMCRSILIIDARTGETIREIAMPDDRNLRQTRAITVNPDGSLLAANFVVVVGKRIWRIKVWNTETGEQVAEKELDYGPSITFLDDHRLLISPFTAEQKSIEVWDILADTIGPCEFNFPRWTNSFARANDVALIGFAGSIVEAPARTCLGFEVRRGADLELVTRVDQACRKIALRSDGAKVAAPSIAERSAVIYSTGTGEREDAFPGHRAPVKSAKFSPDGRHLVTAADRSIRVWDCDPENRIRSVTILPSIPVCVDFAPDGKTVAVGGNAMLAVASAETGRVLQSWSSTKNRMNSVYFVEDGERLISGGWDGRLEKWNWKDTTPSAELIYRTAAAFHYIAKPVDGSVIISATHNGGHRGHFLVRVNATTGAVLDTCVVRGGCRGLAMSPDGMRLAAGFLGGGVSLHTSTGLDLQMENRAVDSSLEIIFGSDSESVLFGGFGGTLTALSVRNGKSSTRELADGGTIGGLALSPDGTRLAVGVGNTVRLLDPSTLQTIVTLRGHMLDVEALAFSPDGNRLASVAKDKTLRIWNATPVEDKTIVIGGD
ncbi:Serine/threonine-protein kinase PrkC [Stratiformator vulcanicus]|uniref:non-specific serine/threonine protein kinase n=2 Tax=Stratiformator vulcanicus TaxID=2527980 RepID=A0A517QXU7_9PLAN|nr:Serine/threonine-protein kinase PrkC [Stratiformator vulcanicus]